MTGDDTVTILELLLIKNSRVMNAMSNNWKPEMLSSGAAGDDSLYSPAYGEEQELNDHIADKKTQQIGRMVEALVVLFVVAIVSFAGYKIFTSF